MTGPQHLRSSTDAVWPLRDEQGEPFWKRQPSPFVPVVRDVPRVRAPWWRFWL